MSNYDAWKTRTPEDEDARYRPLAPERPVTQWRNCPDHGWTEHSGWRGDVPICVACRNETQARIQSEYATTNHAEAQRIRQRALWNRHCVMDHRNPEHCPCIEECACCGHLAAEHALTDGVGGIRAQECEHGDCGCRRFRSDED